MFAILYYYVEQEEGNLHKKKYVRENTQIKKLAISKIEFTRAFEEDPVWLIPHKSIQHFWESMFNFGNTSPEKFFLWE